MAFISPRTWKNKTGKESTRYRVTYSDDDGKRVRRDFEKKVDAKRFAMTLTEQRFSQPETSEPAPEPDPAPTGKTFAEAADAYVQACRVGRDGGDPLERTTIEFYETALSNHVLPVFGSKLVSEIKARDIREFRDTVAAMPRSRRSKRHYLFMAKAVLDHAVENEWIDANPASDIKLRQSKRTAGAPSKLEIHTREEMSTILATVARLRSGATDPRVIKTWARFEAMLHVLVFAGVRISEARGMDCSQVDLKAGTITVSQRADRYGEIGAPKSHHGYRTIQMPAALRERLEKWMAGRTKGLLFPTKAGTPDELTNIIRRNWRPLLEAAGVPYIHLHSVRHFFASMMIHQGIKMKALQEVMGHHDPMFTMRVYGHLFTDPEDVALRVEMAQRMQRTLVGEDDDD